MGFEAIIDGFVAEAPALSPQLPTLVDRLGRVPGPLSASAIADQARLMAQGTGLFGDVAQKRAQLEIAVRDTQLPPTLAVLSEPLKLAMRALIAAGVGDMALEAAQGGSTASSQTPALQGGADLGAVEFPGASENSVTVMESPVAGASSAVTSTADGAGGLLLPTSQGPNDFEHLGGV